MSDGEIFNRTSLAHMTFANADEFYSPDLREYMDWNFWAQYSRIECRIPWWVLSYNEETNEVVVQPTIKVLFGLRTKDGNYVATNRPKIKTTVKRNFAGNVGIVLPITEGDVGWIIAADRDTQTYKAQDDLKTIARPASLSLPRYSFGCFEPDIMKKAFTIASEDKKSLSIQSLDGSIKVVIDPNNKEIRLTAPTTIINGDLRVNGKISSTDTITDGTVVLRDHVHMYTQPNSNPNSTSGKPKP